MPVLRPVLVEPRNNVAIDLEPSAFFAWQFRPSFAGEHQGAWAFRRTEHSTNGSFEWWDNFAGAWVGSEHFNDGNNQFVDFPANAWDNGIIYEWQVAAQNTDNETSDYSHPFIIMGASKPVVSIERPIGSVIATNRPAIEWVYIDDDIFDQRNVWIKVFHPLQYGAPDFNPDIEGGLWESGRISGGFPRHTRVGIDLVQGVNYRTYIQAESTSGRFSDWSFRTFDITLRHSAVQPSLQFISKDNGEATLKITPNHDHNQYEDTRLQLERSTDQFTWIPVRGATYDDLPGDQEHTVRDVEVIGRVFYRARVKVVIPDE